MRNAPFNYLLSLVIVGVLWAVTALPLGNYLTDNVSLETMETGRFVAIYRIGLGVAALLGWAACAAWFAFGRRESTAGDMGRACRVWNLWFIAEIGAGVAVVGGLIAFYINETLVIRDYVLMAVVASLLTWMLFWICSLVMSPRTVKHCVLGLR